MKDSGFSIDGRLITNGDAVSFLMEYRNHVTNGLENAYGIRLRLSFPSETDIDPMNGRFRVGSTGTGLTPEFAEVVFPDVFENPDMANLPADVYDVVGMMVAISHEKQHVRQFFEDMQDSDYVGKVIAVNRYAVQENEWYYQENYFVDPAEIDAQFAGVREAGRFLESLVGHDVACGYLNEYHVRRSESIPRDFVRIGRDNRRVDMSEMFSAYESAFQDAVHSKRLYDLNKGLIMGDPAARFFKSHPSLYSAFRAERDGFEQDRMVASTYFRTPVQKKYVLEQVKADTGVDLSVESAFRKPAIARALSFSGKGRIAGEYTSESRFVDRRLPDLSGLDPPEGPDGPDF